MICRNGNIGFFDSGIGGISVLKNAIQILDREKFIYFGDSKNSPYGSKTQKEIISLCIDICDFLIYKNNCKAIVVACNTATSASLKMLRQKYEPDIPIVGIEPAIKPAIEYIGKNKINGKVLILATPFTVNGEKLKIAMNLYKNFDVECVACNNLAYMIEEEKFTKLDIKKYLYELLENYIDKVDAVVLGCTHYYFIQDIIINILGKNIKVFDGAYGTSCELKRRIDRLDLANYNIGIKKSKVIIYNSLGNSKVNRCYELLNIGGTEL